jgi:hypothetical protein
MDDKEYQDYIELMKNYSEIIKDKKATFDDQYKAFFAMGDILSDVVKKLGYTELSGIYNNIFK